MQLPSHIRSLAHAMIPQAQIRQKVLNLGDPLLIYQPEKFHPVLRSLHISLIRQRKHKVVRKRQNTA